jgi:phosphate:Na+ symporter
VMFHSLFNLLGVVIFLPFINPLVALLTRLAPDETRRQQPTIYIQQVPSSVPDGAIEAVRKELVRLLVNGLRLNMHCFEIHTQTVFDKAAVPLVAEPLRHVTDYAREYGLLKQAESELLGYTYAVQRGTMDEDYLRQITQLNHAIRNVAYGAKFIKDIRHNLDEFRLSDTGTVQELHHSFCHYVAANYRGLVSLLASDIPQEQPAAVLLAHYQTLEEEIRRGYEWYLNEIYTVIGPDKRLHHTLSSLLNINRAAYLSTTALLEAARVLQGIDDNQLVQADAADAVA